MSTAIVPELLTAQQVAELLNVKYQTLAYWRSSGRHDLPFVKVGASIRYRKADIEKWLADRTAVHTGQVQA